MTRLQSLIAGILILAMSGIDSYFTLHIIEAGGKEVNPIMAYYLSMGKVEFIIAKFTITFVGLILLIHASTFYEWMKKAIIAIAWIYLILIAYEYYLLHINNIKTLLN